MSTTYEEKLFSLRWAYTCELNFFGPYPEENVWDVGLLYGLNRKTPHLLFSVSTGIGLVNGVKRGKLIEQGEFFAPDIYEKITFSTIGIPFECQMFFKPFSFLGAGTYIFSNINREESFMGVLVCIQIGKLK